MCLWVSPGKIAENEQSKTICLLSLSLFHSFLALKIHCSGNGYHAPETWIVIHLCAKLILYTRWLSTSRNPTTTHHNKHTDFVDYFDADCEKEKLKKKNSLKTVLYDLHSYTRIRDYKIHDRREVKVTNENQQIETCEHRI